MIWYNKFLNTLKKDMEKQLENMIGQMTAFNPQFSSLGFRAYYRLYK